MKATQKKIFQRLRRKQRVRKRVSGTPQRPRLSVFRSHQNIYAQIIDDTAGRTLVTASSRESAVRERGAGGGDKSSAQIVGAALAEKAVQAGIRKVVFDRGGYSYHGRVKELADAARKGGLEF